LVDVEVAGVERLRDAAVALRRDWEEPELHGRWSDVAVWFGTLGLLGPRRTQGVGLFATFVLISRTWAQAHRRHTRSVNDVIGRLVEAVTEDLEDRAAVDAAVDELAERVHGITDSIGEMGEALTSLEAGRVDVGEVGAGDEALREYLDDAILMWRRERDAARLNDDAERRVMAEHYIDAFQSARVSVLGALLPEADGQVPDENDVPFDGPHQRAYPYEDGDTLVIGPEAFAALPGENVISWRGENYYRDGVHGGVVLADEEADALRAAVMGDHFDNAVMERALAKVGPAHDRQLERESPQSDEELGPRGPSGPFNPPGGIFDRRERAVVPDTGHRRRKTDDGEPGR
jgi:hypothetical protein